MRSEPLRRRRVIGTGMARPEFRICGVTLVAVRIAEVQAGFRAHVQLVVRRVRRRAGRVRCR